MSLPSTPVRMPTTTPDLYNRNRVSKYSECPAREGVAFDATLTLDGKAVATVRNSGVGGSHRYDPLLRKDRTGYDVASLARSGRRVRLHLAARPPFAQLTQAGLARLGALAPGSRPAPPTRRSRHASRTLEPALTPHESGRPRQIRRHTSSQMQALSRTQSSRHHPMKDRGQIIGV
jgi:hypothetical protein